MAVYTAMVAGVFSLPTVSQWNGSVPPWFEKLNPYALAGAPYARPGFITPVDWLIFAGVYLGVSFGLVVLSVWSLRKDVDRQRGWLDRLHDVLERAAGPVVQFSSPSLDSDPVYWREW